jgi:hypothetical protein
MSTSHEQVVPSPGLDDRGAWEQQVTEEVTDLTDLELVPALVLGEQRDHLAHPPFLVG